MAIITLNINQCAATWWVTGNMGGCSEPCGQQKYTAKSYEGNPLTISYFYNTPALVAGDYYNFGVVGTIGFTNQSFGSATHSAIIAADGGLSDNTECVAPPPPVPMSQTDLLDLGIAAGGVDGIDARLNYFAGLDPLPIGVIFDFRGNAAPTAASADAIYILTLNDRNVIQVD